MRNDTLEEMPEEMMEYFCEQVLKRDWPHCIHEEEYPDIIVTYTNPGNEEQFRRILSSTEHINWQKKSLFKAIPLRMKHIVESIIKDKGLNGGLYMNTMLKWMPADEASRLDYEVPADVFIGRLSEDHVDFIYSQWAHTDVYPKSDIWDTVRLNIGLGVFARRNGELLAWAMCGSYGGLSTLMVRLNYRGRGFGKLIVLAITKALGEAGVSPHALIHEKNNVSLSLFKNVGYIKHSSPLSYILVQHPDTSGP